MREYFHLFVNTGATLPHRGMLISPEDFCKTHTIWVFDLSHDGCNRTHLHKAQSGTLELDIAWKNPLKEAVTLIIYCSYDQLIEVTNPNQPFTEYVF